MAPTDTEAIDESKPESTPVDVPGRDKQVPVIGNLHVPSGAYDGRELKPFEGRPGAMDAFKMPSLINEQRVYRWR